MANDLIIKSYPDSQYYMEIKGLYSKREILAIAKKIKAAAYEPIENSVIKQDELIRDHSVMADDNLWK